MYRAREGGGGGGGGGGMFSCLSVVDKTLYIQGCYSIKCISLYLTLPLIWLFVVYC